MKTQHTSKSGRWGLVAGAVVAASLLLSVTAWVTGVAPVLLGGPQTAQQKQAKIQAVEAAETATAQATHLPKPPAAPAAPITSCARGPVTSGISTTLETGGFHEHIISNAIVAPNEGVPFTYDVYAGSLEANPQQGVIIVVRLDQDPCAASAQGTKINYYDTPHQQGAATLTQLSGVTLAFKTAAGSAGHFNVVTGQFSS